ncbi:type I phosphomannose isomerase catalytic subunit [Vallitalea okinawensis]|uniref:type I phosphomannose isomerase catalytic subunit n=1 Tax=Vallitalea okinawensis TaxID=2078660 RepID=UPI000CFCACBE|nr:type I phosphomannose isomerase catalytic subunit [Vallitalea okinawensis]
MYPIFFDPIYKETVWGGQHLKEMYDRELPSEHTGESWEIACHENGTSIVANGIYKGKSLKDLMEEEKVNLLGPRFKDANKFPLLVKLIDANDKLSIQVHPDDVYAHQYANGELGKTEMWYVLSAKKDAKLVLGTKPGTTMEMFNQGIIEGQLEEHIEELEVQAGDVINIPAGMLHAIEDGIVLAEIQQNSDTTYRVYDWNRVGLDGKPRELHIEDALKVIDFEGQLKSEKVKGLALKNNDYTMTYYIANQYFAMEKLDIHGSWCDHTDNINFYLYTCVAGRGIIRYTDQDISFKAGQTFMIPANLGEYSIEGNAELLRSYVPDENNYIQTLHQTSGCTILELKQKIDIRF